MRLHEEGHFYKTTYQGTIRPSKNLLTEKTGEDGAFDPLYGEVGNCSKATTTLNWEGISSG